MKKTLYFVLLSALVLATASFGAYSAKAATTVTTLASTDISADSSIGNSVALPSFTITEGSAGDIAAGTLTWMLPAGFVFDTTANSSVNFAGTGLAGNATVSYPDNTHFSVAITSTSTAVGVLTIGKTTPLKVKAATGTPLASGNITLSDGGIAGVSSSTNFGTLTEAPGATNKLMFSIQPPDNVNINTVFGASVAVQDQFGNTVSADNGRSATLSAVLINNTNGTLSGALSQNDSAGTTTYDDLMFNGNGQIQLAAASANLTGTLSDVITVNGSSTPSSVLSLQNGALVQFQGNPTVYIAINGALRAFTSAAVFHARGRKFEDVKKLDFSDFFRFQVGQPIGESGDKELPPTPPVNTTTTPPTISGLPDGSVVKLPDNPTIYMVVNEQLQAFTSLGIFQAWGKNFSEVQTLSPTQFAGYAIGSPVDLPNGTLVQGSGQTIFIIQNDLRLGIPSMSVFSRHGWSLQNVIRFSNDDLAKFNLGGLEN